MCVFFFFPLISEEVAISGYALIGWCRCIDPEGAKSGSSASAVIDSVRVNNCCNIVRRYL